jgi:hypothetical protein
LIFPLPFLPYFSPSRRGKLQSEAQQHNFNFFLPYFFPSLEGKRLRVAASSKARHSSITPLLFFSILFPLLRKRLCRDDSLQAKKRGAAAARTRGRVSLGAG